MLLITKTITRFSFAAKMSEVLKRDIQRAQRVQENVLNNNYAIQAEAKLRQKVSIESSVQQLENQMRGQIAKSLKRSESKVIQLIEKAKKKHSDLQKRTASHQQIDQYNRLIVECEKARWEFMVHRQAVGFSIRNYQLVTSMYRIPPKI